MHQAHNQHKHQPDPAHHQEGVLVLRDKAAQLLSHGPAALLCRRGGSLGRLARSLGRAGSCRCAAAYCFWRRFFCHRREMGLLDTSWGFSMTDFCQ